MSSRHDTVLFSVSSLQEFVKCRQRKIISFSVFHLKNKPFSIKRLFWCDYTHWKKGPTVCLLLHPDLSTKNGLLFLCWLLTLKRLLKTEHYCSFCFWQLFLKINHCGISDFIPQSSLITVDLSSVANLDPLIYSKLRIIDNHWSISDISLMIIN